MEWWVNWRGRLQTTILSPSWLFKSHKFCKCVGRITQSSKNLGGGWIKKGAESRTKHSNSTIHQSIRFKFAISQYNCMLFVPDTIFQRKWGKGRRKIKKAAAHLKDDEQELNTDKVNETLQRALTRPQRAKTLTPPQDLLNKERMQKKQDQVTTLQNQHGRDPLTPTAQSV